MHRLRTSLLALLCMAGAAHALVLDRPLPDAQQEAQAQQLFHALRCVVCEGQSLAESDATFAQQMRAEIRRMITDGKSEPAVRAYFTERYGARILLTPPVEPSTYLLWGMPVLLLGIASVLLWPRPKGDLP